MIGLDTNVLLRMLLTDHAEQAASAKQFARTELSLENVGFINIIVLAELSWVLEQQLKLPREEIVALFTRLLGIRELWVQYSGEVEDALEEYRNSAVGLADLLLVLVNRACGCVTTITFDRRLARTGLAKLLDERG